MADFAPLQSVTLADIEITWLPDGGGRGDPLALYPGSDPTGWSLYRKWLDAEGLGLAGVGAFAIRMPGQLVLVDAGLGPLRPDLAGIDRLDGGHLPASLEAAGIAPDAVTDLFFTHLHADSAGGALAADGASLAFPNARHLVHTAEWDHWQAREEPAGPGTALLTALAPGIQRVAEGDRIAPSLRVVDAFGHTPGHAMLMLEPGGEERLCFLGDLLFGPQQIEQPTWSVASDGDPDAARACRDGLYPELVRHGTSVAAGRFPGTPFGQIRGLGYGRMWLPRPPAR